MHSSQKATITFVAILLLFLLSFVSAELNKRDPQAPGDAPPAPPAGGKAPAGDAPPAGGKAPAAPAPAPGGNPPGGNPPGGNPPGGNPPGGNPPGGNPPGGNPPGGNPPGGNPPGGNPAGGNPAGGNPANSTDPPKYIDPITPTVQVVMIEPKSSKNILYKIGANITFRWEYSDTFQDPPKFITVAAQPQLNVKTNFTIAQNLTLNATQEIVWVTSTVPSLPMSEYKLIICDQDGVNAPPKPGGLQTFSNLQFGLYTPQDTGTVCATCTNAASIPIISSLSTIGLSLITIISFSFISI